MFIYGEGGGWLVLMHALIVWRKRKGGLVGMEGETEEAGREGGGGDQRERRERTKRKTPLRRKEKNEDKKRHQFCTA